MFFINLFMFSIIENRILKLMTNHQWNNIYGLLNSEKFLCRIREKNREILILWYFY